jgi:hypothetical protein
MSTPEDGPAPQGRKLDIFALPSYTVIIFALIASVILGIAFAALLPGAQLWWPPVVLGLTLLTLRDFLQWPDRLLREYRPGGSHVERDLDGDPVQQQIETALATLAPDRSPELCITDAPIVIESFGTFRRRYVALGRAPAASLARKLTSDKRRQPYLAMLCHELAHFANHDMSLAQLSRSLLKMTVLVMSASIWIELLLVAFLVLISPEILRPEFWAHVSERLAALAPGFPRLDLTWVPDSTRDKNPYAFDRLQDPVSRGALWLSSSLYLLGAQLPFVLVGIVLWLFYWPRLMRIRELYADARAAAMLHNPDAVLKALSQHQLLTLAPKSETRTRWQWLRDGWSRALWQVRSLPRKLPVVGRLFSVHPSPKTRERCLADPAQVFGKWHEIAVTVGLAAILLAFATRGILTAQYIYESGPYLPILITFVITAIWLMPQVTGAGRGAGWGNLPFQIARIVGVIAAMKLLMHFIDLGLVTFMRLADATGWGQALDLWVYVMLGVGAEGPLPGLMGVQVSWAEFTTLHVLRPMVYFGLAFPPLLIGILWADAALKRRALTWYGLGKQVRRVFWISIGVFALLLTLLVIPVLNHLLFPEIYVSWSPATLAGIALGLLGAVAFGIGFWRADRRWAGRCPSCGQPVTGFYYPGKVCQHEQCGQTLHAWLVASY